MTPSGGTTGLDLLREVAAVLDAASRASGEDEDGGQLADLAVRVNAYLAASRPTTPLGMPLIRSQPHRLTDEEVVRASGRSHIRIVD